MVPLAKAGNYSYSQFMSQQIWTAVDSYIVEALIPSDLALNEVLGKKRCGQVYLQSM